MCHYFIISFFSVNSLCTSPLVNIHKHFINNCEFCRETCFHILKSFNINMLNRTYSHYRGNIRTTFLKSHITYKKIEAQKFFHRTQDEKIYQVSVALPWQWKYSAFVNSPYKQWWSCLWKRLECKTNKIGSSLPYVGTEWMFCTYFKQVIEYQVGYVEG